MSAATKFMSSAGGIVVSPWRTEHDIILAFKYNWLTRHVVRETNELFPYLSHRQHLAAMQLADGLGAPIARMWQRHHNEIQRQASIEFNLHRETIMSVILKWFKINCPEISTKISCWHSLEVMFSGCPGKPTRWRVRGSKTPVYMFSEKRESAWMNPPLKEGTSLLLTQHTGGWFVEMSPPIEGMRCIPAAYTEAALEHTHEPEVTPNGELRPLRLTMDDLDNLLQRADVASLRCWLRRARLYFTDSGDTSMAALLDRHLDDGCPRAAEAAEDLRLDADGATSPLCFSHQYLTEFWTHNWAEIGERLNASAKKDLAQAFSRGDNATAKLQETGEEKASFKYSHLQVSLTLLFRIGAFFIKVPNVLQVQPYFQVMVSYDVLSVIQAIKVRLGFKKGQSQVTEYYKRQEKCKACINKGMAFCDRQRVAQAMLQSGHNDSLDSCVPKTLEEKRRCTRFALPENSSLWVGAGRIFEKEMCPCYDQATGAPISPDWITAKDHCEEMRWAGQEEDLRRATKISDWNQGFVSQGFDRANRISLGSALDYSGPKGCQHGFRCCGTIVQGNEIMRCVKERSLTSTGTFRWWPKCKYFRPSDEAAEAEAKVVWSHVRDGYMCAPVDGASSPFDGHWRLDEDKRWVRDLEADRDADFLEAGEPVETLETTGGLEDL
mmetsp:Transcript_77159/g.236072  ORF Transcript_77159/g.236072 Transcript_77159/m.236072 type:complete len:665 (-) Transcript_77159:46-2040(-)